MVDLREFYRALCDWVSFSMRSIRRGSRLSGPSDGRWGQASHVTGKMVGHPAESAWKFGVDVGAAFLIVTLGKRPPMPYVWLPHRVGPAFYPTSGYGVRTIVWSAKMVEVPNPAKFLG